MRGKAAASRCTRITPGITPACAGKSRRGPDVRRRGRDHPRVCGEKYHHESPFKGEAGSPPRVRGKGTIMKRWHAVAGITPACAGKRISGRWPIHDQWDHPRVCGEKRSLRLRCPAALGSPPRVRGKGVLSHLLDFVHGITPACAGKSFVVALFGAAFRDHPRVCGEKYEDLMYNPKVMGSPPRVRGKGQPPTFAAPAARITPACAGKSEQSRRRNRVAWDHPRVCGEKSGFLPFISIQRGSPPRVRGKVADDLVDSEHPGITPACAGKRLKRSHSIGHFSYILCLFHSVLHRASASGGSRAGPCAPPCLPAQNAVPV